MATVTEHQSPVHTISAPPPPRFIVRHTWPAHYELVDMFASSTAKSIVGDYADSGAARVERDRLNREYYAQVAL